MASVEEVAEVRANTALEDDTLYTDGDLSNLIDFKGSVSAASATVWDRKAAIYAELVDQSEAGSSHAWSDLHKNAIAMATNWWNRNYSEGATGTQSPRVTKIVRT
jgi:hypothetical protein